jgi:hypothetical protein
MRLNKVTLNPVKGKDYARLMFSGDWHLGHPQCREDKIEEYLSWALKNKCCVIGMGDYLECGLTTSVGDSVYQQNLNPQAQMERAIELFQPLADAGLLLAIHSGNHSGRILKTTSIDVVKIMAKQLGVPYMGYAGWTVIRVGSQNYTLYSTHGSGGARFLWTKLAKVAQLASFINADCIAHGHIHSLGTEVVIKEDIDLRAKVIRKKECRIVMTGAFLDWDKSYAESAGMPITKMGSPVMKLMADRHNLAVSV